MSDDRQQILEGLNNKQLLVGWFHAYKKVMEQEYNGSKSDDLEPEQNKVWFKQFESELEKRGL